MDEKVKKINIMISDNASAVFAGNAPDVSMLETAVVDFLADVKKLPAAEAKQYLDIVSVWANEIRKMSEKLNQTKAEIESEINQAQSKGKAVSAYTKTGGQE